MTTLISDSPDALTLTLDVRSTATTLVLLSPGLATNDSAAARARVSQIQSVPSFAQLEREIESQLHSSGHVASTNADVARLATALQIAAQEVRALLAAQVEHSPPALVAPADSVRGGVSLSVSSGSAAPSATLTNRRARWLAVVDRASADGDQFVFTDATLMRTRLIRSAGLSSVVLGYPARDFPIDSAAYLTRLKVFGPGLAGEKAMLRADPDRSALFISIAVTALFDVMLPTLELVANWKAPTVLQDSIEVQAALFHSMVRGTAECLRGTSGSVSELVRETVEHWLVSTEPEALGGAALWAAGRCAFVSALGDDAVFHALLGIASESDLAAWLVRAMPGIRQLMKAYLASELLYTISSVTISEPLVTFDIRNEHVLPSGVGSVSGTVLDSLHGTPISGATVRLGHSDGPVIRTIVTDSLGRFTVPALGSARYRLTASAVGYVPGTPSAMREVHLSPGEHAMLAFQLAPPEVPLVRVAGFFGGSVVLGEDNLYAFSSGSSNTVDIRAVDIRTGSTTTLKTGIRYPQRLLIDSSHVFWTVGASGSERGAVWRVPRGGGASDSLTGGLGMVDTHSSSLAQSDSMLFFGAYTGASYNDGWSIYSVAKTGGTPRVVTQGAPLGAFTVAGSELVFSDTAAGGSLRAVSLSGGAIRSLATQVPVQAGGGARLFVAGERLFYAVPADGIYSMSLAGGVLQRHVEGSFSRTPMMRVGSQVFAFSDEESVLIAFSLTDGSVSTTQLSATPVAINETHVFALRSVCCWLTDVVRIIR